MSKNKSSVYPSSGHPVSLSGTPKAFSHIKKIGPEYNNAASGEREKAPLRHYAPRMKEAFDKAHEGPREKIGEPKLHAIHTPSGKVVAEVHSKHDNDARLRNLKKDLQMKRWREAKRLNAKAIKPMHLRQAETPKVFSAEARKAALKKRLLQKKEQNIDEQSR